MALWVVQLQASTSESTDADPAVPLAAALKQFDPVTVLGHVGAVRVLVTAESLVEAEELVVTTLSDAGADDGAEVVSVVRHTPTAELPTAEIPEV